MGKKKKTAALCAFDLVKKYLVQQKAEKKSHRFLNLFVIVVVVLFSNIFQIILK